MNYIVFDLEWNQPPDGKEYSNPLLPFEIVEIGAQKLDENFHVCDTFHAIIAPIVYTKLHARTQEVIKLTEEELKQGISFVQACKDFLFFSKDCVFATWGPMDLTELQRNMRFFHIGIPWKKPLFYYDVQKLYSLAYEDGKTRRSLESAIETLQLPITVPFHRAHHDAYYTALILSQINTTLIQTYYSIDYYQPPSNKKEELHLHYPGYYKYVSREFENREAAIADKTVTTIRCHICNKALHKKIRWFSGSSRIYYGLAECPEHGYVKGKIRIKKTDKGHVFVIKTVKMTDKNGAEKIQKTLEELRRKRRARANIINIPSTITSRDFPSS